MMIVTTAFIRGETAAASKKKGHTPWKLQDQSKRTPKEILAAEAGKFKPPPPMVTPVEKRSSNKFCDFHNDKGHSTDEFTIRSTILIPIECATVTTSSMEILKEAEVRHENLKVVLHLNFPDQKPSEMKGVSRSIAEHRLNIWEGYTPVRQKKKGQALERSKPSKQKTVIPFPKLTGKLSLSAATPLSASWTPIKATTRYRWQNQMKRKRPFTPAKGYIAIQNSLRPQERWRHIPAAVEGMFLGYMIIPEGIKLCPDKTEAVLQLSSPRTIKEVQSLNGKLASLNRFLSKSAEKSLPLFKTLKKCIKKSYFLWTPEAEQAFKQLIQHLSELPLLVAPKPNKEMIVYLSASYGAISVVLMTKRGTVQTPVYFVSRALQGPKLNYAPMEKLVLALVFAAKRTSVKGRILADFLVEKPNEAPPDMSVVETPQEPWTLFMDRSSCVDGSDAGLILTSPEGT
ncbi:reverse transcriptase domain-containing protein [Tanacetum coccineum]